MAAVRWALEPVQAADRLRVLDLGAGTGKLTGVLCSEGHRVTAVEPDEAMLSELVRLHGGVRALPGTAERVPLPDGTMDAVVVGQAFHWFDQERALTEIARVLKPGGVVAALWNADDVDVEWVAGFGEVSLSPLSAKDFDLAHPMPAHPLYTGSEQMAFPHSQRRTAESLVDTISTHSYMLVAPDDERDELVGKMLAYLKSRPETATGEFDLPMRTLVKRQVRV
ncbi:class I SAM-dependent methyltransferase [Umezawaea sp. Da 62-37]|uniref:class I SAM-dependent methyltransferase n=1 Tax=Umezawaea sp. Da 62-37 TaxID=3075927 RepID=UPI0028F6C53E|nr:class I SAM-dependent methyltransferase [Umezawaea sp. Da 62-37]WNV91775.1 class I SAM-dependent methyltransferase [Umezawaea sp. Da 62-37]